MVFYGLLCFPVMEEHYSSGDSILSSAVFLLDSWTRLAYLAPVPLHASNYCNLASFMRKIYFSRPYVIFSDNSSYIPLGKSTMESSLHCKPNT